MIQIPFSRPAVAKNQERYALQALRSGELGGDKAFTKRCQRWIEKKTGCPKAFLTPSATHALEIAALLSKVRPGDEVILPSFTFPSTANAFVLRGAQPVFVDIRPDTLNLDESLVEAAITGRTKAIIPVHYNGVACEMTVLNDIATRHGLLMVEDAASAMLSRYRGVPVGTLGDLGCFSFHETKNFSAGEGGALLLNREELVPRAEILREKGTNRAQFFRKEVEKYTWMDCGSSYLPSDFTAALLFSQFEEAERIRFSRLQAWDHYFRCLSDLPLTLPYVPAHCEHNGHAFAVRLSSAKQRADFQRQLARKGIQTAFHYQPLHSSPAGRKFGRFHAKDKYTTAESAKLVRLPLYPGLAEKDLIRVVETIRAFFRRKTKSKTSERRLTG